MALVIGTGAAGVESGPSFNTITTGPFSPPANALLVALATGNLTSAGDCRITAMTNTGTALASGWAQRVQKGATAGNNTDGVAGIAGAVATIWTGVTGATPGAITVTATQTADSRAVVALAVLAFTDDGGSVPTIGANASSSNGSGVPTVTVPGCNVGSYVASAVADWGDKGAGTYAASWTNVYDVTQADYSVHMFRTTDPTAGGSQAMTMSGPASQNYNQVALEIRTPSVPADTTTKPGMVGEFDTVERVEGWF